jgi:pimeloyl-ACP methyl ester carboxylesterase
MMGCSSLERRLLFFPSHRAPSKSDQLSPWADNGETIGFTRTVSSPKNIWLMLHGNGGQASDREYALSHFSDEDSVYVLEYPGYGHRRGKPSQKSFNTAAAEAYFLLRKTFSKIPICVVSESIGSGPACHLASLDPPPDKLVLIVPFDNLESVARDHFPGFVVYLLLSHKWDNKTALAQYKGPIDIFSATNDTLIPPRHARALAAAIPQAKPTIIPGGHNDWSEQPAVKIRNP